MAITVITQPQLIAPIYNPLIVTCSSTHVAQPNFKYVFDVYVDYPTGVSYKRFKLSARPDGYGMIDVHRVLESYLSYDFSIAGQSVILNDNSYVNYRVRIGEEYGTTPAVTPNLATITKIAFNGALKTSIGSGGVDVNFIDFDFTEYSAASGTLGKFLTSSPRTIYIDDNQSYALHFMNDANFISTDRVVFKYYEDGFGLISTRNVPLIAGSKFARVLCGTRNIRITNPSDLTNCVLYTVQIQQVTGATRSELFVFEIKEQCSKAKEHFRLHWLNELGGFDSFNFNYTFKRKFNIQKQSFEQMLGRMSSGAFTYSPTQKGKSQFNTVATEKIEITSDWITEEESKWLSSLVASPQIFWEIEQPLADTPTYIPVLITNGSYQQKTYAVDNKLFELQLEMEIGNDINKQRQ
ncbi:MAG: hypothetical protein WCJ33_02420 [Pseudomonadota bacterium]